MRHSYASVLLLAGQSLAAPVDNANETPAGVLHLPLVPVTPDPQDSDLSKRQAQADLEVYRFLGRRPVVGFGMPLEIGTPAQTVIVEPDTGSDLFWVPQVRAGKVRDEPASVYFDKDRSTSRRELNKEYGSRYGQNEFVLWNVSADVVSVKGRSLGELQFGVANLEKWPTSVGRNVGILGLRAPGPKNSYANEFILKKMLDNKVISDAAFSMSVDEKGKGAITLGGYDTKKFAGPLDKFPFASPTSKHYVVNMKSISVSDGTNADQVLQDQGLTIGLDSGAPAVALKKALYDQVAAALGATVPQGSSVPVVNCTLMRDARLTLAMSDTLSITIPVKDFEMDIPQLKTGGNCPVAIISGNFPADVWIGGHFLRRAYVVYDSARRNIHVARVGNCGSNVVAISGGVPTGVVGECAEQPLGPIPAPDAPGDH
ncbi:Peptidase aspartic, partial [Metarhizium majus ARSEF 297]